ncbi:ATP-binding protein [Sphingomonas sp. OTU376]|uniref:ATP-binding protein n=1 Tax=Sphingomonas sp. OTU376 TaxID=3043863 RepID=UPI00313D9AFD
MANGESRPNALPALLLVAGIAAAILLVLWALIGRQVAFDQREAERLAFGQNDDRALMLQQYVSRTLDHANMAALHIEVVETPSGADGSSGKLPRILADPVATDGDFLAIHVADATGHLIATTERSIEGQSEAATLIRARLGKGATAPGLIVSPPVFSPRLHRNILLLSKHFEGVRASDRTTIVAIDPAKLTEIFGAAAVKPSESAWVVGLDGIIRSRTIGGVTTSGQDVSKGVVFRKQREAESGRFAGPGALDGQMRLVSHRRIPGQPLFVSYSILEDEALRDARARARLHAAGGIALSAAIILLASLLMRGVSAREKRALDAAAARERLEEAQRIARMGDWSYRTGDETVTWSPNLYEMYERDPALGPMGKEIATILSENSIRANKEARDRLIRDRRPISWELEVRLPKAGDRIYRVSGVPTLGSDGSVIGFHGTTQDVTEARRHDSLQAELAHFARVGAMNSLTATLSHELTQPLAAASNYLSTGRFLADRLPDAMGVPIAERLADAGAQIKRAGDIIQRMRSLVARGSSERNVVAIDVLLEEALETVRILRICDDSIARVQPEVDIEVYCDAVQIQQVILNLVRNACEAQKGVDAGPPTISVTLEEEMVRVGVRDHGPGFAPGLLQRLSQPFLTSKENGLGLGLSISRTIIEAHGGALRAENHPEGGALLSFTLPLAEGN